MTRLLVLATALVWSGVTIGLSRVRWFARPALARRIQPYLPNADVRHRHAGHEPSVLESALVVLTPAFTAAGDRLAELAGVSESLSDRLRRLHRPDTPAEFRLRQGLWAGGALGAGAAISATLRLPAPLVLLVLLGAPVLAVLIIEQQLSDASRRRQHRLFLELPVVAEQFGMLISAGYSLGSTVQRLAGRGHGVASADLRRVVRRIDHGVAPTTALREWATIAQVDALDRLVAVLALNQETGDLGRLVSEEARSIRRDVQRELMEAIERRSQQVWIPVTVAALIPGAIFIAIPFIEALRAFGAA